MIRNPLYLLLGLEFEHDYLKGFEHHGVVANDPEMIEVPGQESVDDRLKLTVVDLAVVDGPKSQQVELTFSVLGAPRLSQTLSSRRD